MPNLKFLMLDNIDLSHDIKYLPNSLKYLEWSHFPSETLPSSFQPLELAAVSTPFSKLQRLWDGTKVGLLLK